MDVVLSKWFWGFVEFGGVDGVVLEYFGVDPVVAYGFMISLG